MTIEELKERIDLIVLETRFNHIDHHQTIGKLLTLIEEYQNPKRKPLEVRKQEFRNKVLSMVDQYEISLLDDFIDYWTEHGDKDKKMRFEKEKSFGISRRLKTWARNQQNWGTKKTTEDKWKDYLNS